MLQGKKIVICITGSVAAIETPKLVRELRRKGAIAYCVMSKNSKNIINPKVLEWASGNEVITELTGKVEHVMLCGEHEKKADFVLIAPSTANTIGKIAAGIDDTPVTTVITTALGSSIPIIIVPAMHISMYNNKIVIDNITKLKRYGICFINPRIDENKAKFPDPGLIVDFLNDFFVKKDLVGRKIVVTAGATIEEIDPARIITNKSSGKMGIAIATRAAKRGAEIKLISGNTIVKPRMNIDETKALSSLEMSRAIKSNLDSDVDVVIHCAAVSDFKIKKSDSKIRSNNELNLELMPTTKILDNIKKWNPGVFLVGFKAEYNLKEKELINSAYQKLRQSNSDLVVANDVGKKGIGFFSDKNEVYVVDKKKNVRHIPKADKLKIADQIIDEVAKRLR